MSGGVAGYVAYSIDSAYDVRKLALAYDQIFEGIQTDRRLLTSWRVRQRLASWITRHNPSPAFSATSKSEFSAKCCAILAKSTATVPARKVLWPYRKHTRLARLPPAC